MAIKKSLEVVPEKTYEVPRKSMSEKVFPFVIVLMMVMSFALGSLWTKVKYLENPITATTTTAAAQPQAAAPAPKQVSLEDLKTVFGKNVIKFGDANKKNLLIEIADPSCPFCHVAAGKNPELSKQMGAQFLLVSDGGSYVAPVIEMKKLVDQGNTAYAYIYSNGHGAGEMAQKTMYCAHDQGKFWVAHDKLMTNDGYNLINNTIKNDKTKSAELVAFLGNSVNGGQLKSCLDSGKYDGRIAEDQALAASLGVNGTPGFFVNDKNFAGAYSWNDMKSALN